MLRAVTSHQSVFGCGSNGAARIFSRNWRIPPLKYRHVPKPIAKHVTPEMQRLKNLREACWKERDAEVARNEGASERFIENSKLRSGINRAKQIQPLTYILVVVGTGGLVYIWYTWRRDRKQVSGMREAALNVQLTEDTVEEIFIDKTDLPRPIVMVGPTSTQKTALVKSLVRGRETLFGFPVLHTTRGARKSEEEGEEFWFAPVSALEHGVYSGAFVSHGHVKVGDKKFNYGLSKGSVADVRLAGRVCLLDMDMEYAEVLLKTDLRPLIVLVTPAGTTEYPGDVQAAKRKGVFHLEVSLTDSDASLEAARDSVLNLLAGEFERAAKLQQITSGNDEKSVEL